MCWPGGGFFAGGARSLSLMGWLLAFLAAASLGVGIANTVYTFIKYNSLINSNCGGMVINMCRVIFTYISSGIWGSIPIFFTGLIGVRLTNAPAMMRMFQILVMLCALVFAPAMIVLSSLEIVAWNGYEYNITSSSITGDVTKFALPLVVDVLAALEFLILLFLMCCVLRRGYGISGVAVASTVPAYTTGIVGGYGGDVVYGGDVLGGDILGGDGFVDGGDMIDAGPFDPGFGPGYGPGPQFIPAGSGGGSGGGGGAAGGGAAGGSAAASSPGGGGSGGASNNNNNNIVVPPVIIPPAPAAAPSFMPFPIYLPGNNSAPAAPIIINTTTNTPNNPPPVPPPQPVFLPLPGRRRPPPRPLLRPLPPTRYYSGCGGGGYGLGGGFRYGSGGYNSSFDEAFQGKPWNRF